MAFKCFKYFIYEESRQERSIATSSDSFRRESTFTGGGPTAPGA